MGSDTATVNGGCGPRDAARKKKTHRSARLKQCKRDARREQWLSQVNRGEGKEASDQTSPSPPMSPSISIPQQAKQQQACGNGSEARKIGSESNRSRANQAHSPGVPIDILRNPSWGGGSLEKDFPANSFGGRSSSNSSCWRSDPEDDRDDDESGGGEEGSLDDWEAFADSLTTTANGEDDDSSKQHGPGQDSNYGASMESTRPLPPMLHNNAGRGILKTPEPNKMIPRAWRPDDAFRPQSLPNLSKQRNYYPMDMQQQRHCAVGTAGCAFQALSCPICCEDLDVTDSSFLPCSCGFRLCLFCHKRILEADSRCPGCRKVYTPPVVAGGGGGGDALVKGAAPPLFPVRYRGSMNLRY